MKKILVKALSLLTAIAILFTLVAGCDLVTTNTERDMNQVVARIQIDSTKVDPDEILKRELVSAYNSYGAYYQYYYSYTAQQVFDLIMDNLVQNRVVAQQAKIALSESNEYTGYENGFMKAANDIAEENRTSTEKILASTYKADLKAKSPLVDFLTEYEKEYSKYNFYTSILSSITSLIEKENEGEEDDPYETITISSPRTVLTSEQEEDGNEEEMKEEEVTEESKKNFKKILKDIGFEEDDINTLFDGKENKYDFNLAVYKAYNEAINDFIMNNNTRKRGLVKVIRNLNNNGFITAEENKIEVKKVDDILQIGIFEDSLEAEYEARIITKYELALENMFRKQVVDDPNAIYNEFVELYNFQKQAYQSITDYETALNSDNEFILYSPIEEEGKYGYVLNLLVGFGDDLTASLDNFKQNGKWIDQTHTSPVTKEDIEAFRAELAEDIIVVDQRTDWLQLNYGKLYYKENDEYIENTEKVLDDTKEYYFGFDEKYVKTDALRYYPVPAKYITVYEKTDEYGNKVLGYTFEAFDPVSYDIDEFIELLCNTCGFASEESMEEVQTVTYSDELYNKFLDFIYGFSTDGGSLKENDGYIYSSITSGTTYVPEFAEKANELIENGVGSFAACLTDYGVHFMLCTKVLGPTSSEVLGYIENIELFDAALKATDDNIAKDFKDYKLNLYIDNKVQQEANRFITNGIETGVKYFEKTYADLIQE